MIKKIFFIILAIFLSQTGILAQDNTTSSPSNDSPSFHIAEEKLRNSEVYTKKNLFGLRDTEGNILTPAIYQKIIMVGREGWIIQKNNKFGLMDLNGNILIKPKYRFGDRLIGRFVKLGNNNDYGIYNDKGEIILPPIYSSIDLLYGRMFLTSKNYRYGVTDFKGNILIPNICDDIYMSDKNTMKIKYLGTWYEVNDVSKEKLSMPDLEVKTDDNNKLGLKEIITDTGAISGYSVLTFSDYLIKVISSISPAHEETIDELILSHGVDTVGILKKSSWVPKYPVTFIKNYYTYLRNPFNGPLSDTRNKLRNKK